MFAVLSETRPSTSAEMVRGWARLYPDDAADLDRILRAAVNGSTLSASPEIWLANDALMTGTSLFDQYRALPRPHTFDANAALPLDWLGVAGVTSDVATMLIANAPYPNLETLLSLPALSEPVRVRITAMAKAMTGLRSTSREEESLSPWAIAVAYFQHISVVVLAAAAAGAWLARRAGVERWGRAVIVAFIATILVLTLAWVIRSPPWYPLAAPVVIGGAPWALWRIVRRRGAGAAVALAVWLAAALPAWILTRSW
jgi:hypothetical protein